MTQAKANSVDSSMARILKDENQQYQKRKAIVSVEKAGKISQTSSGRTVYC